MEFECGMEAFLLTDEQRHPLGSRAEFHYQLFTYGSQ